MPLIGPLTFKTKQAPTNPLPYSFSFQGRAGFRGRLTWYTVVRNLIVLEIDQNHYSCSSHGKEIANSCSGRSALLAFLGIFKYFVLVFFYSLPVEILWIACYLFHCFYILKKSDFIKKNHKRLKNKEKWEFNNIMLNSMLLPIDLN